jgi:hypothetical protein
MDKKTEERIVKTLEDISRSLRIISGREDIIRSEKPKNTYKDKYFAKSK